MWSPTFSCVPIWRIEHFIAPRSFNHMRFAMGRRKSADDILTPPIRQMLYNKPHGRPPKRRFCCAKPNRLR
jgi:hypothetical protein